MKILALVTARGGSKGFPSKNLAFLRGRPLVRCSHSVLASFRDGHPGTKIWLSTDSQEICAAWPAVDRPHRLRPPELAGDTTPSIDVVEYELAAAAEEGFHAEAVLLVQPTSPLVELSDLESAYRQFMEGTPSVVGVTPLEHPVQWAFSMEKDGLLASVLPPDSATRRQDLATSVRPVGFYLCGVDFLKNHRTFTLSGFTKGVMVPTERGIDIDHPSDLALAEWHARQTKKTSFALGNICRIGEGCPCSFIAEARMGPHDDVHYAKSLVQVAAEAGADGIIFRGEFPSNILSRGDRSNTSIMDWNDTRPGRATLKAECERAGIHLILDPCGQLDSQYIDSFSGTSYKIYPSQQSHLSTLKSLVALGRPILLGTGSISGDEVVEIQEIIRITKGIPMAISCCPDGVEADKHWQGLRTLRKLLDTFDVPVGFSDYAPGCELALAAVGLGAHFIEKPLVLDRQSSSEVHETALTPTEFAEMIAQARRIESRL